MAKRADAKDRVIREQARLLRYVTEHSGAKAILSEGFMLDTQRVLIEVKVLLGSPTSGGAEPT